MSDRAELRAYMRAKVREIKNTDVKSAVITRDALKAARGAESVFVYRSFGCEVATDKLIAALLGGNKRVYLPVVIDGEVMRAVRVTETSEYVSGAYGIMEPLADEEGYYDGDTDVTFVPMLAYDNGLNRMGKGKGYYDRYLAAHETYKIGLAFAEQRAESVFPIPTDVRMDMIITDEGILL